LWNKHFRFFSPKIEKTADRHAPAHKKREKKQKRERKSKKEGRVKNCGDKPCKATIKRRSKNEAAPDSKRIFPF
jgi:hypothetical protein